MRLTKNIDAKVEALDKNGKFIASLYDSFESVDDAIRSIIYSKCGGAGCPKVHEVSITTDSECAFYRVYRNSFKRIF